MKKYLTFEEQLDRLINTKKMKIFPKERHDTLKNLKNNNYINYFTPFKMVFAKIKKDELLDWKYILGKWKEKNKFFNFFQFFYEKDKINNEHIYEKWFTYDKLKKYNENNKKFSEFFLNIVLEIERRIKTILANNIGKWMLNTGFSGKEWIVFLEKTFINNSKEDIKSFNKFKEKVLNKSNYIWINIEEFTIGNLKFLLEKILNKKNKFLDEQKKKELVRELINITEEVDEFLSILSFISKLRNFLAHSKNIQYFFILEINEIIQGKLKEKKNFKLIISKEIKFLYRIDENFFPALPYIFDLLIIEEKKRINEDMVKNKFKKVHEIYKSII
ncbi:TM1812 family CRISPR-associated protein [Mycoplasma sp. 613B]